MMIGAAAVMAKSKKRITAPPGEIAPTPERRRQGFVERFQGQIVDEHGNAGHPFQVLDTLARLLRANTISPTMRQAGEEFHTEFVIAGLDGLKASDIGRAPGSAQGGGLPFRLVASREKIYVALVALGGINSPAGCCAWHVLGRQSTIEGWALSESWRNRPLRPQVATGILVSALGVLELHFGLAKVTAPRV